MFCDLGSFDLAEGYDLDMGRNPDVYKTSDIYSIPKTCPEAEGRR